MPKLFAASEPRSSPLNMKTTKGLRARLEASAAVSGRALTHEAEYRIEQALDFDREFNGFFASNIYNNLGKYLRLFNVSAFPDERYIARACLKSAFAQFVDQILGDHGECMPPSPLGPDQAKKLEEVERLSKIIADAVMAASHLDVIAGIKAARKDNPPRVLDQLTELAEETGIAHGAVLAENNKKRKKPPAAE